jgi:hypothetical protein
MIWTLLFIVAAHGQLSRHTCSSLGWVPTTYGSVSVCGESRLFEGACGVPISFGEAKEVCARVGARLCTAAELQSDEARDTGCGIDALATWARDSSCPEGSARTLAGSSQFAYFFPSRCRAVMDTLEVRCCADEYEQTACAADDKCSYNMDARNQCVDLSAITDYECRCEAPGWTDTFDKQSCIAPPRCLQGECATSVNKENRCTDHEDGTYSCTCARQWELTETPKGEGCLGPYFSNAPQAINPRQASLANEHSVTVTPRAGGFVRCVAQDANSRSLTASQVMAGEGIAAPPSQGSVRGVPLVFKLTRLAPDTDYSVVCATDGGGLSGRYTFTTATKVCQAGDPCATADDAANFCLNTGSEYVPPTAIAQPSHSIAQHHTAP